MSNKLIRIHPAIKPFKFVNNFLYLFLILQGIMNGTGTLKRMYLIGSRKSAKTKSVALMFVIATFLLEKCTIEMYRKFKEDLKEGWHAEVQESIEILGVGQYFKKSGDTYLNTLTGNKIRLAGIRGASGKVLMAGRNFKAGHRILIAIDEAYELTSKDWEFVQESIRGGKRTFFLLTNPWSLYHWFISECNKLLPYNEQELLTNHEQFKITEDNAIGVHYSNYLGNELLTEDDKWEFEQLKIRNPKRYRVAGLGMAGMEDGAIYENLQDIVFTPDMENKLTKEYIISGDYGETNDAMAFYISRLSGDDPKRSSMRVIGEFHWRHKDDYYYMNGKKYNKSPMERQAPTTVIGKKIIKWAEEWTDKIPDLMRINNNNITGYVDNTAGAFIDALNDECSRQNIDSELEFRKGTKKQIHQRITRVIALSGAGRFTIDKEQCPNLHQEWNQAVWKYMSNSDNRLNKTLVRDGEDHGQDAVEYALCKWWNELRT